MVVNRYLEWKVCFGCEYLELIGKVFFYIKDF